MIGRPVIAGIVVATRHRYRQPQQQQRERDAFKRQQREFRNCDFHDSNSKATGYFYCDILAQLTIEAPRHAAIPIAIRVAIFDQVVSEDAATGYSNDA
jgi:hypothetical protein